MVFNPAAIGAGAALIGVGTVGNYLAGRSRERAFNRALNQRESELGGFQEEREGILNMFQQELNPLSAQTTQNSINALNGITSAATDAFGAGQAQGIQDIGASTAEVFGQAGIGADFAPTTGAGAGALSGIREELAPGQEAFRNLSAGGLGRLAQQQALEGVGRQQALSGIDVQNRFQNLQESRSLQEADLGLRDLQSNLVFQQATQEAGRRGGALQAFSGLAQQAGGALIASGATVAPA